MPNSETTRKKTGNNEYTFENSEQIAVVYHDVAIVRYHKRKRVMVLDHGGWNTPSTREHMRAGVRMLAARYKGLPRDLRFDKLGSIHVEGSYEEVARVAVMPRSPLYVKGDPHPHPDWSYSAVKQGANPDLLYPILEDCPEFA